MPNGPRKTTARAKGSSGARTAAKVRESTLPKRPVRNKGGSGTRGRLGVRGSARAIRTFFKRLERAYGPQRWWPGATRDEVVIGAILAQNTAWENVERAIDQLRAAGRLDLHALHNLNEADLAELIHPAGPYRVKARRLKSFVHALHADYGGSLDRLFAQPTPAARQWLLAVPGIGPETADAILLYVGGHAIFVVDAYTMRLLRRHLLLDHRATYAQVQELFEAALPRDAALFNEYHALLVHVGREHCRARARCDGCPLATMRHDEAR